MKTAARKKKSSSKKTWIAGVALPALGLGLYAAYGQAETLNRYSQDLLGRTAPVAPAQVQAQAPDSHNTLESWKLALWVAQPAEFMTDMPLSRSYAKIDAILRNEPRPVPLIRALLDAHLQAGGVQEILHQRAMGGQTKVEARRKLALMKIHLLQELASIARAEPGRFKSDLAIRDLQVKLQDVAEHERDHDLSHAAARALEVLKAAATADLAMN